METNNMETNNKQQYKYEEHTFKSFLTKYRVTIPMVQRDYAQGRVTDDVIRIRQRFLGAIKNCMVDRKPMKMDFIYGEIEEVWNKTEVEKLDRIIVTPLDGQQRLTTLFLLHWYAAKRDNANADDYTFLKNFNYDIRPSSRDFITHLLEFAPSFKKEESSLKEQLADQYWFMGDWHNDPTIEGMLVMLDAIGEEFADVKDLWNLLTGDDKPIVFFFLPLSENGLSDKLYIKMNSRGKKLTPFEHFKAEYEGLYGRDSDEARKIGHKFDVKWADMLFSYRDSEGLTDKEFMRYFYYISHILCYQQSLPRSNDEFELIRSLYQENANAGENRKFFEDYMDCWYEVKEKYGSIKAFFDSYLSQADYKKDKVVTYKTIKEFGIEQDFFGACIKLYQVNNNFSYSDFLFLYGIIVYLLNKDKIGEPAFIERLRILRNLIWSSDSGEIRQDNMHDLLAEVDRLMLSGVIKRIGNGFNKIQEDEEIDKQTRKAKMTTDDLERMYKYEDHPLIYGYVSGLGCDNLDLTDTFYEVFKEQNYSDIHLALISIGDYTQHIGRRYYMGNDKRFTWTSFLHKNNIREDFEKFMKIVRELLRRVRKGESLEDIRNSNIEKQESKNEYTWWYYFSKYPEMLRGSYGELDHDASYDWTTLNKHQFNGMHWNSFLNVIHQKMQEKTEFEDNRGGRLMIYQPRFYLVATEKGFDCSYPDRTDTDHWEVAQDNNNIDTEDRIQFAINKIEEIMQEAKGKGQLNEG